MDIYVGNLSYSCTDDDLKALFGRYGSVASARVVKDRMSGQSKGFGFVEMPEADEARQAIAATNAQVLLGRPLRVTEAKPKERPERPRTEQEPERGMGRGGIARY